MKPAKIPTITPLPELLPIDDLDRAIVNLSARINAATCRNGPQAATTAGVVIRRLSFCSLAAAASLRGLRAAPTSQGDDAGGQYP